MNVPADRPADQLAPGADTGGNSRAIVLAAAIRAFAEHGFAHTRTRQIADAAGVNHAVLFYHFKSKTALYLAAFQDQIGRLADGLELVQVEHQNAALALQAFVEAYLTYHLDLEPGLMVTLREFSGLPNDVAAEIQQLHYESVNVRLIAILEAGVAGGTFRPLKVAASARTILSILQGYLRVLERDDRGLTRADAVEQVLEYYGAGLLPGAHGLPYVLPA